MITAKNSSNNTKNLFFKPDKPYLLLSENSDGIVSYSWLETEEQLQQVVAELKNYGDTIIDAIEIGSARKIKTTPTYSLDCLINEIKKLYNQAKEQDYEDFSIIIKTDENMTYHITESSAGFQYEEMGYYYDDLTSVVTALFEERMIGKPAFMEIECEELERNLN